MSTKTNYSLKTIGTCLIFLLSYITCRGQEQVNYYNLLDSASVYIDIDAKKTWKLLDSIPKPLYKHIDGRISEYYAIKALLHDEYNQYSKFHQSNILALKYAILEKNYCVAGQASLDLHTDKYLIAGDTIDTKYLDQAILYFEKCKDDKFAVLQIEQMQAYYLSLGEKLEESNTILLNKLDYYSSIKNEEGYYYMFANYLLASNYLQLKQLDKARTYFNELKSLKDNNTILPYNHKSFIASMDLFIAEFYFEKSQIDSTLHYLQNASKNSKLMAGDVLKDYYKLSANIYKQTNNIETSKVFIDSLVSFQDNLYFNNVDASFDINNSLLKTESELGDQKKQKVLFKSVMFCLIGLLFLITLLYFLFYRRYKFELKTVESKAVDVYYLKSNNEQLAVKVHGLEEYIKNLKQEVKDIASVKCLNHQKLKIKELYTNLHINSSTILDKGESHLELINDLNIDFFKKISVLYPQLNKSEVIICYYVLIGFTNKEIAVFLNTSIRSVESKRYRISKKINFDKKQITLSQHLQKTFKQTLHHAMIIN